MTEKVAIDDITDYFDLMRSEHLSNASITIRKLDPALKARLRVRAVEHGHSMEAEARAILQTVLTQPNFGPARNLYERIRARLRTRKTTSCSGANIAIQNARSVARFG
jgi:plasmid stability protein